MGRILWENVVNGCNSVKKTNYKSPKEMLDGLYVNYPRLKTRA